MKQPKDGTADADADAYSVTREIALHALDRRAYSRAELADYLTRKGAKSGIIDEVLRRFEEVNLINDRAFANQWVDTRQRGRLLPRRTLVVELRRKGIDEEIIAEAVATVDRQLEEASALELARQKARNVRDQDEVVALRRIAGVLGRRGYSGELAWAAAKQALNELSGS